MAASRSSTARPSVHTRRVGSSNEETLPLLGQVIPTQEGAYSGFREEFKTLLSAAFTVASGYLLQQAFQLTSIFIIGQLGPLELSIAAFSYMIAGTTGFVLAIGGTIAIDYLGSTSIGSGEDVGKLGVLLQKYILTVSALFVPISLLWFFSSPILVMFHVSPTIAYGAQSFLRCLLPFAPGYILFEALKKFLQCQEIRAPGTIIILITAILNIPLSYLFVHVLNWGPSGGAMATGSMYWLSAIMALAYIKFVKGSEAWCGWSRDCLDGLGAFARIVLLGIVSVGAEWWAFEAIAIVAGSMGEREAAAQSIVMTTDTVLALFPFGVGIATSNRVASLVGAGNVRQAKLASRVASFIVAVSGCITMVVLLVFRYRFARLFTDDSGVIEIAVAVFPFGAAFQISDGLQAVNAGTLRAIGKVDLAAAINVTTYYLLAIPVAVLLAFNAGYGLSGLWAGLCLALTIAGASEFLVVNFIDWKRLGGKEPAGGNSK